MEQEHLINESSGLLLSQSEGRIRRIVALAGEWLLFLVASLSVLAVLFIFYFIIRDSVPFIKSDNLWEFFNKTSWYPTHKPPIFGALPIFYGSLMVTVGACVVAVPLGICSAIALSDILPFGWRQTLKPVIELLASIPSVAYGFFALVVFAPWLQNHGGGILRMGVWLAGLPVIVIASLILGSILSEKIQRYSLRHALSALISLPFLTGLYFAGEWFGALKVSSGTNALNVSVILGIMALPTIVSVSEDALQAVGPELRMGSYGLGATRAETLVFTVLPAASSGICAGVILGIMRALGETMVVWMASGNAAAIPEPWYNFLAPVRTLTATIAGEMGETARDTQHYSVLFMTALCLLAFCFVCNLISEKIMKRRRMKLRGEI